MNEILANVDLGTVLTIILAGLTTFLGVFWKKAKTKITKVIDLGRQAFELMNSFENAIEDDKVTKEEIAQIKKEAADVKAAWKALVQKE